MGRSRDKILGGRSAKAETLRWEGVQGLRNQPRGQQDWSQEREGDGRQQDRDMQGRPSLWILGFLLCAKHKGHGEF